MMRGSTELLFALQFYLIFKAFFISFVKVLLCGATGQPQALYQPYNSNTKWQWHFTTTVHWCCPLWIGLYARWSLWTTENGKHLFMNDICRVTWHRQLFWIQEHISEWRGTAPALPPPLGRRGQPLSNWCQKSALSTALTISSFTKYAYAQFNDQETWSYVSIVTWGGSSTQDHACYFVIFAAFYCWLSR